MDSIPAGGETQGQQLPGASNPHKPGYLLTYCTVRWAKNRSQFGQFYQIPQVLRFITNPPVTIVNIQILETLLHTFFCPDPRTTALLLWEHPKSCQLVTHKKPMVE